MIIFLSFPVADIRKFQKETTKLPRPTWPTPIENKHFIRSYGAVRRRSRGGAPGWVGEDKFCDANNAIIFNSAITYKHAEEFRYEYTKKHRRKYRTESKSEDDYFMEAMERINLSREMPPGYEFRKFPPLHQEDDFVRLTCASRHFYFDGLASGRHDFVFITDKKDLKFNRKGLRKFFSNLFNTNVIIKNPALGNSTVKLVTASEKLAELYKYASSYSKDYDCLVDQDVVFPGSPICIIEFSENEDFILPKSGKQIQLSDSIRSELYYWGDKYEGVNLSIWAIKAKKWRSINVHRMLRLYLSRIHIEHENLQKVLEQNMVGNIGVEEGSEELKLFQHYLNVSTRRIIRSKNRAYSKLGIDNIDLISKRAFETAQPGFSESLLQSLEIAKIRPQLKKKVIDLTLYGDVVMGQKYNIGKIDNVGVLGSVHTEGGDVFVNQNVVHQSEIDFSSLSAELSSLRKIMKEHATSPEHDIAIGEIARAEQAAEEKDKNKVMESLKRVGAWTLEVAKDIGVPITIELIKASMGLS